MRFIVRFIIIFYVCSTIALADSQQTKVQPEFRPLFAQSMDSQRPVFRPTSQDKSRRIYATLPNPRFVDWIETFKGRAQQKGIKASILNAAFQDITYDEDTIFRDRNQSEYTKAIWEYLDHAVSQTRIQNGKKNLNNFRHVLEKIEARYDVDKEVIVAIWGLETNFSEFRGSDNVIQSLATLAFDGRRGDFFESQLLAALKILQSGDTTASQMTGSWAGAMGHTQFMPTSFLEYAVDFTGDGRRDIWSNDPTDSLASTAAYLKRFGWKRNQPWGIEVQIPANFNFDLADPSNKRLPSHWAQFGVLGLNGLPVQDYGGASLLMPAGLKGAKFLIFDNFKVIKRYNPSNAYAIGVGHLSDRLKGRPSIQASWPRNDRPLISDERKELQSHLANKGFYSGDIDGKIGPVSIAAIRAFQNSVGMVADGYISFDLLNRLRQK